MKLRFTKMQGAGNDFVVLDGVRQAITLSAAQSRWLADRHFGIGADQLLLVQAAPADNINNVDFSYRIFNADGGEVEHCGNGARCFAKFVRAEGLTDKSQIRVQIQSGVIVLNVNQDDTVTVDMGAPILEPSLVPFNTEGLTPQRSGQLQRWTIETSLGMAAIVAVSMGNPHAVQIVEDVSRAPVLAQGLLIENHPRFPMRVNAGFLQIVDRSRAKIRVFERGAGETLACGTGICAAAVAVIGQGLMDSPVQIQASGGTITVAWDNNTLNAPVLMTGPATRVFSGEVDIPHL